MRGGKNKWFVIILMDIHLSLMNVINYMTKFTKSGLCDVSSICLDYILFCNMSSPCAVKFIHIPLKMAHTSLPVVEKIKNQPIFYFNSENCLLLRKFGE